MPSKCRKFANMAKIKNKTHLLKQVRFWWRRGVTKEFHGNEDMDRLGKTSMEIGMIKECVV